MPRAYSMDLRERVVAAAREEGLTHGALAARFRVGESTVRGWLRRARETGSVAAKPHGGGGPPKVGAAGGAVLAALVAERNDRTLAELAALYGHRTGVAVSIHAVARACRRLDLRRKKKEPGARRAGA
jgi:putative transposase